MSTPADFSTSAQSLIAAVLTAVTDPADALRALQTLAAYDIGVVPTDSPIGAAANTMVLAQADLFRRSAVIAMARASTAYTPSSANDAAAVRDLVCGLLDAEITVAGDQGQDSTYAALRALKASVYRDLTTRGADLAVVRTVSFAASMPALALAQRLYQDATRADDLVARANPRHPAFMPVSFEALSE